MVQVLNVEWIKIDRDASGKVLNTPKDGGVYIFTLNGYPFYVGTAEKGNLKKRLKTHDQYFKNGKRTYLDLVYFSEHSPWTNGLYLLNDDNVFEKIYVPGISGIKRTNENDLKFSKEKSVHFWKSLEIFFGETQNSDRKSLITLEKHLQITLQNRFIEKVISTTELNKNLSQMIIPGTISTFFGKVEASNYLYDYEYEFNLEKIKDSNLAKTVFPMIANPDYIKLKY